MEKKSIYQVIRFDRSTNEFDCLQKLDDWNEAVKMQCFYINQDVTSHNMSNYSSTGVARKDFEYVTEDAMNVIFENGQNWIINNRVYGIIDITCKDVQLVDYEDVVLLVDNLNLDETDIKAMQMPFDSLDFFNGYMKRVVEVFGGTYDVMSLEEFDQEINDGSSKVFAEFSSDRPFVIHTKLPAGSLNKIRVEQLKKSGEKFNKELEEDKKKFK